MCFVVSHMWLCCLCVFFQFVVVVVAAVSIVGICVSVPSTCLCWSFGRPELDLGYTVSRAFGYCLDLLLFKDARAFLLGTTTPVVLIFRVSA